MKQIQLVKNKLFKVLVVSLVLINVVAIVIASTPAQQEKKEVFMSSSHYYDSALATSNQDVGSDVKRILNDMSEKAKKDNIEKYKFKYIYDYEKYAAQMKYEMMHINTIRKLKYYGLTGDSDLGENINLTSDDMDKIIDRIGAKAFKGKGYVFVEASRQSGLNPVYILAHAAIESAWGESYLARTRGNYFGINAIDSDPDQAHVMGSNMEEGIIAGSMWIKRNFYDNGYKTLNQMKAANYATDPNWVRNITSLENRMVSYL